MIKKYGIGFAAVLIALSAAAFTNAHHVNHPNAKQWFVMKTTATDPSLAGSYQLAPNSGDDPGCPTVPDDVCAVRTDPDPANGNIPTQSQLDVINSNSHGFTTTASDLEYKN